MPSGGYGLSITSLPYTVLWRPCACSHNLRYGEGRMLQGDGSQAGTCSDCDVLVSHVNHGKADRPILLDMGWDHGSCVDPYLVEFISGFEAS